MKVFITVDMEGISGLVRWDANDRQRERELMTAEANAAIAGAFAGGATEVLVGEAHANMRNLMPEAVDERARFFSGEPKPLNHMGGLDESFGLALLIGYHARAGARNAVMCHTYDLHIHRLAFNGIEVGELGTDAALAGHLGVPIGLVAGDRAACDEGRALLGDIETVAVKDGRGRYVASCLPPAVARQQITEAAARAVSSASRFQPFVIPGPVTCEVEFTKPECADMVEPLPFVERTSGREIRFVQPDLAQTFHVFNALNFLSGRA
ncbi:M55 family metallopeptidase [bacterium]|nr:M55 family metallopeptidase [bacterium]